MSRRQREMREGAVTDWATAPPPALVDYVLNRHHAFMRQQLPRMSALLTEAAQQGGNAEAFLRLRRLFGAFRVEIEHHLLTEELGLFPLIRGTDAAGQPLSAAEVAAAPEHVRHLAEEHLRIGPELGELRRLTAESIVPRPAGKSLGDFRDALQAVESDLSAHAAFEDNVLFPRVLARQGRGASAGGAR
jgi:regulator of cell morphogenesis and NO signaling